MTVTAMISNGQRPDALAVPVSPARRARRNSFRGPPDPPPQDWILEIHAFSRHERR